MFRKNDVSVSLHGPEVDLEFRRLCPEDRTAQKKFYREAIRTVHDWMGPLVHRPFCDSGISQLDLQVLIAANATQIMEASNYRAWGPSDSLLAFQRAVFLRGMVVGLGVPLSATFMQHPQSHLRWRPFQQSGREFFGDLKPKGKRSNIVLPFMRIEQSLLHHLFPDVLKDTGEPMAAMALIGSFDAPPDPANPVVSSLRRAVRKVLRKHQVSPGPALSRWIMEYHPTILGELDENGILVDLEDGDESEESARADGDGEAAEPAMDAEAAAPSARAPGGKASKFSIKLATLIRNGLADGSLKASCRMAPFHGFRGVPCLVWPAGVKVLSRELQVPEHEQIEKAFRDEGWVYMEDEEVVSSDAVFAERQGESLKRKASVTLAPLTECGMSHLLPESGIPDNASLALPEEAEN